MSDSRGGKGKTVDDDPETVNPINQSVAMAIAGNPFGTLARNALASMASMVRSEVPSPFPSLLSNSNMYVYALYTDIGQKVLYMAFKKK